jgi:hypothetical protein
MIELNVPFAGKRIYKYPPERLQKSFEGLIYEHFPFSAKVKVNCSGRQRFGKSWIPFSGPETPRDLTIL